MRTMSHGWLNLTHELLQTLCFSNVKKKYAALKQQPLLLLVHKGGGRGIKYVLIEGYIGNVAII